ncbi:MAG: Gfo/Idh/MocA family protein [Arachnia sp.]
MLRNELTVGIVGMGSIGITHAKVLQQIDGVRLVAYSGGTTASGGEAGWPAARQMSHEDLVDHGDVDIVVLCSPTEFHGASAIAVAESGRHVVIEKPMTLTVAEAESLVALQEHKGIVIAMVAQRRFETEYQAVKELLEQGQLGDVRLAMTHVPWFRSAEYFAAAPWRSRTSAGGGSLVNQGVHNIDLLQWLCGPVQSVTAQTTTFVKDIDVEDTTVATARFASGALGVITTSTATPPGFPATVTLYTSLGMIELGQGEIRSWEIAGVPCPPGRSTASSGSSDPAAIGMDGHIAVWEDVVGAIREKRRPLVDAVEGAGVTRLIRAIYDAAETGCAITLSELH